MTKDWRAAESWLERKYSDEFAKLTKHDFNPSGLSKEQRQEEIQSILAECEEAGEISSSPKRRKSGGNRKPNTKRGGASKAKRTNRK